MSKPEDYIQSSPEVVTITENTVLIAPPTPQPEPEKKKRGRPRKDTEEDDETPKIPLGKSQIILDSESGATFEQLANKKNYMQGWDSVTSALYDGETIDKETTTRGLESTTDPYFNLFLGGTENIPETYDTKSFRQGFYNRPFHVHVRDAIERPKKDKLSEEAEKEQEYLTKVIKALWHYGKQQHLTFGVHSNRSRNAKELIQKYKKQKLDEAEAELKANPTTKSKLRLGYYGNLENSVEKLSGIYALARYFNNPDNLWFRNQSSLVICYEDVEQAISFYDRVVCRGLEQVLTMMSNSEKKHLQVESYEKLYEEIKDKLLNSKVEARLDVYEHAMTYERLYQLIPSNYKKFAEYIQSALEAGIIEVINAVPMKIGHPARVVQLKEDYVKANTPKVPTETIDIDLDNATISGGKQ